MVIKTERRSRSGQAEDRTKDPLSKSAKEEDVAEHFKEMQKDINLQKTPPQLLLGKVVMERYC